MKTKEYDIIILGGGTTAAAAGKLGRAGKRVALIEKSRLGGTCPNRGCVPSKLLLGYAEIADTIREAERFHITSDIQSIDADRIVTETIAAVSGIDKRVEGGLPETVDLYRGEGRFVSERTIQVEDVQLKAPIILISTGTRPLVPEIDGLSGTPFWTSDHVFELSKTPRSIAIIGGGYIGCELAQFFSSVGIETTVVHRSDVLLRAEDEEIQQIFKEAFTKKISVLLETSINSVAYENNEFRLSIESSTSDQQELRVEALLFAIGRVPNSDSIGLEHTGVETNSRGFVNTDRHLKTSADGIYALGDVRGEYLFTHAAAFEADFFVRQILEDPTEDDFGPMPHAVFSNPEIAGVGKTEQELCEEGIDYLKASLPYTSATKGRAIKEQYGLCKLLFDSEGTILGCHIIGSQASVLLHEVIPVMRWKNNIRSLTGIIHIHPSLSEVVRNTARKALEML